MIFGNKSPVSRIQRVMPIVSHHKIIILLESISIYSLSIDKDFVVFDTHVFMPLVFFDGEGIFEYIFFRHWYGPTFRGNFQGPKEIFVPIKMVATREYIWIALAFFAAAYGY